MRLLILLLLIFFLKTNPCPAQNSNSIVGKWNLYAVMDDEYYHNFNNDSTSLSYYFKEQLIENKKDTIYAIQTIKEVV